MDAERHLTSVQHSKLTGAYVDTSAGHVKFKAFAEGWRVAQVHRPSTAAQIETNLRRHVYPRIGDRPIGSIRPSEIQTLVKWLAAATRHEAACPVLDRTHVRMGEDRLQGGTGRPDHRRDPLPERVPTRRR